MNKNKLSKLLDNSPYKGRKNKVLYVHIRNDSYKVFYVGVGSYERAYSLKDRNQYWRNIVNKHGYITRIVMKGLTQAEAFDLEILLIKSIKDDGQPLANLTRGGEGRPDNELRGMFPELYPDEYKTIKELRGALPQWWHNRGLNN